MNNDTLFTSQAIAAMNSVTDSERSTINPIFACSLVAPHHYEIPERVSAVLSFLNEVAPPEGELSEPASFGQALIMHTIIEALDFYGVLMAEERQRGLSKGG